MIFNLAQSSEDAGRLQGEMVFWSVVFIGILLVLWGAVAFARKRAAEAQWHDYASRGFSFSLQDLRIMHEEGKLTDEEYERAKARITATTRAELHEAEDAGDGEGHGRIE